MVFEPRYEKLVSSVRKKIGVTQVVVESNLPLNNNGKIEKVLCANANAYVNSSEQVNRDITFNGYVGFQVVYLDEEGNPQGLDYTAEFRDRYVMQELINGTPILKANVVEVKYSLVNGGIKISAIVEIDIDSIVSTEIDALVGGEGENTFYKNETINYLTLKNVVVNKFEVIGDAEIKDSVQKVLSVCPSAFIDSVDVSSSYITVKGGVNVNVCYISDESDLIVRSYNAQLDFAQEIASEHLNSDVIQSLLNVALNDVKVTISMDANSAVLSINIPLIYNGYVFEKNEKEIVSDLFNINNNIGIDYQSFDVLNTVESKRYEEKISGNVRLESQPFIDEVTGVCCNKVMLTNSSVVDESLLVQGVALTTVVYFNKEDKSSNSVEIEIPFSLSLDYGKLPQGFVPSLNVAFGNVMAKSRRGNEIDVEGRLFVFADYFMEKSEAVISKAENLEEKMIADNVLSIYIVKDGDTIWEISKEMNVSPDVILEQNQDLELPLKAGDKIVVYKQKVVAF